MGRPGHAVFAPVFFFCPAIRTEISFPRVFALDMKRKEPKPIELKVPSPVEGITDWIILGLDPSLSRTGYSIMHVGEQGSTWIEVGSIKPESASEPVWIRSKAIALAIQQKLYVAEGWLIRKELFPSKTGLIISFEAPTPGNDWLSTISRILHLVLLDQGSPTDCFARVFVQLTNAATLRRLMGLVQRGNNKKENVAKAYTFLDKDR